MFHSYSMRAARYPKSKWSSSSDLYKLNTTGNDVTSLKIGSPDIVPISWLFQIPSNFVAIRWLVQIPPNFVAIRWLVQTLRHWGFPHDITGLKIGSYLHRISGALTDVVSDIRLTPVLYALGCMVTCVAWFFMNDLHLSFYSLQGFFQFFIIFFFVN